MHADPEERRIARRHPIKVPSSVLVTIGAFGPDHVEYYFLTAIVWMSLTGVALLKAESDARLLREMAGKPRMKLLLPLSESSLETILEPVRYMKTTAENDGSVLVGAQIVEMQQRDHEALEQFILQLK